VEEARIAALRESVSSGALFVSAYNDPRVIAGGGTVGLEIAEDLPEVDLVVVGMGGGGLAVGTAIALQDAMVWGVQPEASAVLNTWLRAGRQVDVDPRPSIADGLGAHIESDSITFPLAQRHVRRVSEVSEEDIKAAVRWLADEHRLYVEPSGAAPVAALVRDPELATGHRNIVVILTGRNISLSRWLDLIRDTPALRRVQLVDSGGTT
jgi:threonine dehydratase